MKEPLKNKEYFEEDIAALATPPGTGGIAIIRMSGEQVIEKIADCFVSEKGKAPLTGKGAYTLNLGWLLDEEGQKIDQVLIGIMKKPHSYTGENVAEINCHGGALVAKRCLQRVMRAGIRLAEPGEFTKRAFLNGRLDASQAEAISEIIQARSEKTLQMAMKQLEGINSKQIGWAENKLIETLALLDASLDFPEEVGEVDLEYLKSIVEEQIEVMQKILKAGARTEIYRRGIELAICGKPNVGKSTLLNVLLRKERAIVTDTPGTTRDTIEDYLTIKGIPVKIIDTAGIRETQDPIERIGVEKAKAAVRGADIIIFMLDGAAGINEEDQAVFVMIKELEPLIVVNKDDLSEKKIQKEELARYFPGGHVLFISALEDKGLDLLEAAIEKRAIKEGSEVEDLEIMINIRHKDALNRATRHLEDFLTALPVTPADCLSIDIRMAAEALGEISGKNLKEEAIEMIFREFCIGK